MTEDNDIKRQMTLYFVFAAVMIGLNYLIQKLNQLFVAPFVCDNLGTNEFFHVFYCSTEPFNMPELIGSIFAVGITYIIKFFLDKFIVFKKTETELKQTSIEFIKYFGFAILTTIENIGIQFLLTNFLYMPLEISFIIALAIGYLTKFFLDRRYVFNIEKQSPWYKIKKVGFIDLLFIDKKIRRGGVSKLLINKAYEIFKKKNLSYVKLTVLTKNPLAHQVWLKHGFKDFRTDMYKRIK